MTKPNSIRLAILALILLALIWGYNWVQMKIAVEYAPPFTFAAWRTTLGALALFAVMGILRKPLTPKAVPAVFLMGLFQMGGVYGLANWALVSGGAGRVAVLVYTMPFWSMLFAWWVLGERLRPLQWLAVGLSIVGMVLILDPQNLGGPLLSKVLAVLSGMSWAIGNIIAKKVQQSVPWDLLSLTTWQTAFGAIPLIGLALLLPGQPIEWTPALITALIYNVIPATAIALLLWLFILQCLSAGTAGLGMLLTPVVGVIAAWIQLGERPSINEWIGMGLVVAGLVFNALQAMLQIRITRSEICKK